MGICAIYYTYVYSMVYFSHFTCFYCIDKKKKNDIIKVITYLNQIKFYLPSLIVSFYTGKYFKIQKVL